MPGPSSDVAFTLAVKAIQAKRGSRERYAKVEQKGGWRTTVTPDLAGFLGEVRSFYLATGSAAGQPYVQHRGGPPGFLRVVDERTLGFADFKGNRQAPQKAIHAITYFHCFLPFSGFHWKTFPQPK